MTIKLLHKLFIGKQFEVKDDFNLMSEDYFKTTTEQVDFHDTKNAIIAINSWVSKETNGLIKELINYS